MNKIFLKNYSIKTPEVYSVLTWQINNTEHIFQIDYPSNPVLDIELMVLHNKPLEEAIVILANYIKKKEYPQYVIDKLGRFLTWMSYVVSGNSLLDNIV